MTKFLVLYRAPIAGLEAWMKKPEADRKVEEEHMKAAWSIWMKAHGSAIQETAGAGATKRVTSAGIADVKNDIMLYSIVEATSADEAAKLFEGHPHFGIPEATIEIMPAKVLPGMEIS